MTNKQAVIQTNEVPNSELLTTRSSDDYVAPAQKNAGVIVVSKDAPRPEFVIIRESTHD